MKRRILACVQTLPSPQKKSGRGKNKNKKFMEIYTETRLKTRFTDVSIRSIFFLFSLETSFHRLEEFIRRYLRYASSGLQARILNPNLIFKYLG